MTRRFPIALLLLLATGCAGTGGVKKSFDAPRMPAVPKAVATPIDPALQARAREEIARDLRADSPVLRAQAFEALSRVGSDASDADAIRVGLADREWVVRYAAALAAGDRKLAGVLDDLRRVADDSNANVRVAARYALHRNGDFSRSRDLEPMSQNADPRVRASVALVLGLLGEPTGVRLLRPMLRDLDDSVRLAAAESLWELNDDQGLKNLVAGTISPFPDEQIVCVIALARPGDTKVKEFILGKLAIDKDNKQYVELQLAAARALGMLGDDSGTGVALEATRSAAWRQRSMAAFALGAIGRPDAQPALAKLLDDRQPEVRLAAATALRQIAIKANG